MVKPGKLICYLRLSWDWVEILQNLKGCPGKKQMFELLVSSSFPCVLDQFALLTSPRTSGTSIIWQIGRADK